MGEMKLNKGLQNIINVFNEEIITLLKQKIENCIMEDKSIIINISENNTLECRNTFFIDDYEISEDNLYLNDGNFELHINLNETEMKYDNNFEEITFIHSNIETKLYFE